MKGIQAGIVAGFIAGVLTLGVLAACDDDRGAQKDLPNANQNLVESDVDVVLMPDGYANIVHKCLETTGIWTNTNRNVWIVFNDPQCGGTTEREIFVVDNIPGSGG